MSRSTVLFQRRTVNGELRVLGIRCPQCYHARLGPGWRPGELTPGERVTCSKCGWSGHVPG